MLVSPNRIVLQPVTCDFAIEATDSDQLRAVHQIILFWWMPLKDFKQGFY